MRVRCRLRHREAQRARLTLATSTDSSCRLALTSAVPITTLTTMTIILLHRLVLLDDIAPRASPSIPLYTPSRFSHARALSNPHTRTQQVRRKPSFHFITERERGGGVTHTRPERWLEEKRARVSKTLWPRATAGRRWDGRYQVK